MKPHLVYRLVPGARRRHVESLSWAAVDHAGQLPDTAHPEIDAVFARHAHEVRVAQEYEPASASGWTDDERASGLHRAFRAIEVTGRPFSRHVVDDLRRLDVVAQADVGRVASIPLSRPARRAGRMSAWAGRLIGLDEAHRATDGDERVVVAVLDTGIDPGHPELVDRLGQGRDFVDIIDGADEFLGDAVGADDVADDPGVGHGTHVAGIVAGRGDRMPRGVVPACRVLPVRVLGALRRGDAVIGAGLVDNINNGIKWGVDRGASVINMSLGIRHDGGGLPHADVIDYARRRGVVVVAAAGNDGSQELYYPGSLPGVLAVGAVDETGQVAHFSTWGEQVDLVAPGTDIYSSFLNGGYAFSSGTSQAAPFVAGAAALLRSAALLRGACLSDRQIHHLLLSTADRLDHRFKHPKAGNGVVNLADALRLLHLRLQSATTTHRPARPRVAA